MSLEKAHRRVSQLLGRYDAIAVGRYFDQIQNMPGASRLFARVASASKKDVLEDFLSEVKYALVFSGIGLQVEVEPYGKAGPDLRISQEGHSAVVEIMHFRKVNAGPPVLTYMDETELLPVYGNTPKDIEKAFGKIQKKLSQIGKGESVIAIWNDDERMEEKEVEWAVDELRNDVTQNTRGLLFVLYGSLWIRAGDNRQFYCYPVAHVFQPHHRRWQDEIEASTLDELIQRASTGRT